jgi:two-component system, OmpR family, phosphate regulon sensor histidine kinase PhoR
VSAEPSLERLEAARRALEFERARYDELFELTTVASLVTDSAGVIVEANAAAAGLWMTEPHLLIGKPLTGFVPLEERRSFRDRITQAAEGSAPLRWLAEFHGPDGARIAAQVTVAAAFADRELVRLRWVIEDVSEQYAHAQHERRLASEYEERVLLRTAALQDQRNLLEAVIENIPAALFVIDTERRPMLINDAALRLLGLEPGQEEDVFRAWQQMDLVRLDGTVVEADDRPIGRTLASGEIVSGEIYEVELAGQPALLELSTAPVTSALGERIGALAVVRDVTARERAEQAERDFVTNAAHELQSPLAAIVSAVEVLQAGAKDGPERDVFLTHIERESARLARLARALLILARSQIGLEAPRDELVGLCALLQETADGLKLADGVDVEVACDADLAMLTNRELVEQALINLAENAAKQTRKGKIVLGAQVLADRFVEFTVADTGPGILASERAKVFERFYRADGDGTSGFGLGLAIVRAVADALDGELELDSTLGEGTTVRLRVPGAARLVDS